MRVQTSAVPQHIMSQDIFSRSKGTGGSTAAKGHGNPEGTMRLSQWETQQYAFDRFMFLHSSITLMQYLLNVGGQAKTCPGLTRLQQNSPVSHNNKNTTLNNCLVIALKSCCHFKGLTLCHYFILYLTLTYPELP